MKYLFLIIFLLNFSCYKKFEISNEYKNFNKQQIIELIKDKERELEYFKKEKSLLENRNKKILFIIEFQRAYNIDVDYLQNSFEKNKEIINKIDLNIKKILLELKLLKKYI